MEIGVLGPLRVTVGDHQLRLPAKQQTLLAVLALEPNTTVSTDRLLVALWDEDASPAAVKTLQSHVFQLRRALAGGSEPAGSGGPTIETEGRGYRLRVDPETIDARRFERLFGEARAVAATDARGATERLATALALWRRPGLPDVGGEPGATAELDRLAELRDAAFDQHVRLRMSLGETAEVVPELRRGLRESPYREPLWASLMTALAASGRKAEALIAYRDATEAMRRELDVEPSDELQALAARIRDGSPGRHRAGQVAATGGAASDAQAGGEASDASAPAPGTTAGPAVATTRPRRVAPVAGLAALGVAIVVVVSGARLLSQNALPAPSRQASSSAAAGSPTPEPVTLATDSLGRLDASGRLAAGVQLGTAPDGIVAGAGSWWITSPTDGTVLRVDEESSTVVQRIRVGHAPAGIAFGFGAVWVANSGDRTVDRIDPTTNEVVATIETGTAPTGVAVDDRWVWVTNRLDHSLTRIDPGDQARTSFAVGSTPLGITSAGGSIWVADGGSSDIARVDPESGAVIRTVGVGTDPTAIAASPGGDAVWVVNTGSGTVFRIDTTTATVTAAQSVGVRPTGVVVDADAVWVAISSTNEIVRLDPTTAEVLGRSTVAVAPRALAMDGSAVAFTAEAAAGSHRGGTLRIVTSKGDLPPTPDPTYAQWGFGGAALITNDSLVTYKRVGGADGLTFVPDLAEDIPEPADGGRTWTFRLRPGLLYSDGRPVRASDALQSFERGVLAGNAAPTGAGMFRNTAIVGSDRCGTKPPCDLSQGITIDDIARTITFHLTDPDPDFESRIFGVPIVPADTPLTNTSAPIPATGPYEVASFSPNQAERLVRNPTFHEFSADAQPDGNPDEIDLAESSVQDPTTDVIAGKADYLHLETESAARMEQLGVLVPGQIHVSPSAATWFEMMNTRLPPFDKAGVREAVNLATDRSALVGIWGGPLTATVTCQVLPPDFTGFERYCPWTVDPSPNGNWVGQDLNRARQLIDAAGVRGMRVTVWGGDDSGQHAAVAHYFAGLLDELGFKTSVRLMGFDAYFQTLFTHPERVQIAGYWNRAPERTADAMLGTGFTCPTPGTPFPDSPAQWCEPKLDQAMHAATALEATDPLGANQLWAGVERKIVDAAPAVWPFDTTDVTLLSSRVGGFEDSPEIPLYDELWVQ